jgi:hypothetical protein
MTVRTQDVPYVPEDQRLEVVRLGAGFFRVVVSYGFMDQPDVPRALEHCRACGLQADPSRTSYFIGRETLIPTPRPPMGSVEARVFAFLSAGSLPVTAYFRIRPRGSWRWGRSSRSEISSRADRRHVRRCHRGISIGRESCGDSSEKQERCCYYFGNLDPQSAPQKGLREPLASHSAAPSRAAKACDVYGLLRLPTVPRLQPRQR